ncbi:MAG: hypothetical protein KF883_05235 [Thermomicrobiales bacterium]|nr:hypothetical protein [Thermomicrobiales bacterium]
MRDTDLRIEEASAALIDRVRVELPAKLGPMIELRRWFADKDRGTPTFRVADIGAVSLPTGTLLPVILEAIFATGEPSRYFLPLLTSKKRPDGDSGIALGDGTWLGDPVGETLGAWLLEMIATSGVVTLGAGSIAASSAAQLSLSQIKEPGRPVAAEQSNSSIRFDSMIAKVYRRLSPGVNPDVEVGAFFTRECDASPVPRFLGSLSYRTDDAEYTLAMLQEKIDSPEDGWFLLVDALRTGDALTESIGQELGALTASMHLALSNETTTPEFAAERATRDSVEMWCASTTSAAETVIDAITSLGGAVNASAVDLARRLIAGRQFVMASIDGYRMLEGESLIRVHGDYHLGQVLRDGNGAWWAVDFEGEPRRPIAERARKSSPLKDVAGMLRSFSYARATALGNGWSNPDALAAWETRTRQSFIESYVRAIRAERPSLLPASDATLTAALTAWEVDKALYEVQYELSSRPEWLWVPLQSIVERVEGG